MMRYFLSLLLVCTPLFAFSDAQPNSLSTESNVVAADWSFTSCKKFSPSEKKLVRSENGAQIYDLHFTACDGNRIDAYWVTPEKMSASKQPAILFTHWLDFNVDDANRNEFLPDAKNLAQRGISSLLVSTFWSVPDGRYKERRWQNDFANTLNQTRDLLQALAWIKQQPQTDLNKLAYVGHDYGGSFGAMVSGVDADVKYFVLMTPIAKLTDWYLYGSASGVPEGDEKNKFIASFVSINPETQVKKSKATFFLQFSNKDQYVSQEQANQFIQAAPKATQVKFYEVEHSMKIEQAKTDRLNWLVAHLLDQ